MFPLKHDGTMDTIKLANWGARQFVERNLPKGFSNQGL